MQSKRSGSASSASRPRTTSSSSAAHRAAFEVAYQQLRTRIEAFLALYAAGLGIPAWQIGIILGVQLLSIVFAKPLMGRISDRVGRRRVILPGLVLGAASVLLLPLVESFLGLCTLSLAFGLGFATVTSSTAALVADLTRNGRFGASMGVLRTVMDVGQSIGPVLTGWMVVASGYGGAFTLLAAILLGATLLLALVPRSPQPG
jgi:MFS family permease